MSNCYPQITVGIVAIAWLSSFAIPIMCLGLVISGEWVMTCVVVACIFVTSTIPIWAHPTLRDFVLNGISEAVGGTTVLRTEKPLPENRRVLYAIHPHGLTSTMTGLALGDINRRTNQRVALVVAPMLRWLNPLMRIIMGFLGVDLLSSDKHQVQAYMGLGEPVGIVVGGFEEMLRTQSDKEIISLKHRRGFLKQAIRHGYSVVPVFCFGESQIYNNRIQLSDTMRDFCAKWKLPAAIPSGAGRFSFMPRRLEGGALIVFGKPMRWGTCEIASTESFSRVHADYMNAVQQLYNQYNPYKGRQLEIA